LTVLMTWSRALLNALLAALSARPAAALLTTPEVMLYSAGPAISPDAEVADFTAVIATGIAPEALAFSGVVNLPGGAQGATGHVDFVATTGSPFVQDTAIGYIITDGTSAFYGGELFESEVNFGQAGDALGLDIIMPLPHVQTSDAN